MSRVPLGMLLGLVIGAVDVLLMLPLSFPDRRASFAGAFCARFLLASSPRPYASLSPVVAGVVVVGLLTSAPDAIITKAYAPILVTGLVFGAAAGWIVGRFGAP